MNIALQWVFTQRRYINLVFITYVFFRQIRLTMDYLIAVSIASALVSSRLDYANSVLVGCPQKHIAHLQQVLARVVSQQSTPFLHPPTFWNNFIGSLSNGESSTTLLFPLIEL